MELTKDDIGRTFLWLAGSARLAKLIDLNPADDQDVKIAPDSGGKVWVNPAELFPVKEDSNPTAVAALINIALDLDRFERIKVAAVDFLKTLDEGPYVNDLSIHVLGKLAQLRAAADVVDPQFDPEVFVLGPKQDKYGRIWPYAVDDDGNRVEDSK